MKTLALTRRSGSRRWTRTALALAVPFTLIAAACGGDDDAAPVATDAPEPETDVGAEVAAPDDDELVPVRLQLQWFTQSQFAGYYAAVDLGFYEEEGLDVTILEGAVDIVPQQVLASGQSEFAIAWTPKALASREEGLAITNIAQVFGRSGTLQVSWLEDGITTPEDLAGTTVGNWGFGNELELLAAIRGAGLDPDTDVELVQQNFDMQALIDRQIQSAQAMSYNEFGILLQTTNPETGELYTPDLFNVLNWNDVGSAMLQDAVWARTDWLEDPANADIAKRFLRGSMKGWIHCRDNPEECAEIVLNNGPALDALHMLYMMNEVNPLIWPAEAGIGVIDEGLWAQTVEVALGSDAISAEPDADAFSNELITEVLAELEAEGFDVTGSGFTKIDTDLSAAAG